MLTVPATQACLMLPECACACCFLPFDRLMRIRETVHVRFKWSRYEHLAVTGSSVSKSNSPATDRSPDVTAVSPACIELKEHHTIHAGCRTRIGDRACTPGLSMVVEGEVTTMRRTCRYAAWPTCCADLDT